MLNFAGGTYIGFDVCAAAGLAVSAMQEAGRDDEKNVPFVSFVSTFSSPSYMLRTGPGRWRGSQIRKWPVGLNGGVETPPPWNC